MAQKKESLAELDRIVIFPENTRNGVGTQLLRKGLVEQRRIMAIIVSAGKEDNHARRFCEEKGFKPTIEKASEAPHGQQAGSSHLPAGNRLAIR